MRLTVGSSSGQWVLFEIFEIIGIVDDFVNISPPLTHFLIYVQFQLD